MFMDKENVTYKTKKILILDEKKDLILEKICSFNLLLEEVYICN